MRLTSQRARHPSITAYLLGGAGYALGLVLSAIYDLPSGALIAWMMVGVALVYYALQQRLRWLSNE
jgi:zinc/manganese transport system permease protein